MPRSTLPQGCLDGQIEGLTHPWVFFLAAGDFPLMAMEGCGQGRSPRLDRREEDASVDCGRMTAPARGRALQVGLALASASAACRAGRRHARPPASRHCKRLETRLPTRLRRPDSKEPRGQLRQSFAEPRFGVSSLGGTPSRPLRQTHFSAAIGLQKCGSWTRSGSVGDRAPSSSASPGGTRDEKRVFENPILLRTRALQKRDLPELYPQT